MNFIKPKRAVDRVFLHCSASNNPKHNNVETMRAWHLARGFKDIGYHYFITTQGAVLAGRPLEQTPAAQEGNNTGTIAICLHGLNVEDFTLAQFDSLRQLCDQINAAYPGRVTFHGHREVANKLCPVFDYKAVLGLDNEGVLTRDYHAPAAKSPVQSAGTLQLGMQGDDVKDIQRLLGFKGDDVDGDFGEKTDAAVRSFQMLQGLLADGRVGNATRAALKKPAKPLVYEDRKK